MATTNSVLNGKASIKNLLLGTPLPTTDMIHQHVSKKVGLAVFASDALSSTAYATEEILVILAFAGSTFLGLSLPIAIGITALLALVTLSYRQTIHAYPNGGGAYIVARDNLGELPAQIAGAALLTDYILTVSVSVSNGVQQIASAIEVLRPWRVELALVVIIIMTIVNLRGVKESGRIFAVPTYFFLGMSFILLIVGGVQFASGNLSTVKGVEIIQHDIIEPLGLFLILRAFSSGCTALTGIEAISNGITAFKEPKSNNAARTLMWMSGILIVLFLGFTLISQKIGAVPSHEETVISQIARTIFGLGPVYYMMMAGTALILLMAANTSFADFPRLAALHAGDGFLPRQMTIRGSRLVFSWGIMALGLLASLLVVFFQAETSALIPLYAIGVFLSFTLSQAGMAVRTWKVGKMKPGEEIKTEATVLRYDPHWRTSMALSAFGSVITGIVMVVFAATKFMQGAWFICLLIPLLVVGFFRIHYHYRDVAKRLSLAGKKYKAVPRDMISLLFVEDVHMGTLRMVNYAKSSGTPWKAIHIAVNPAKAECMQDKWRERIGEGTLEIVESPYRQLVEPIREVVMAELDKHPEGYVNVVLGHLAMDTYWEQALHQNSALVFNLALQGLNRVIFTNVPYQIHHSAYTQDHNEELPEIGGAPSL